MPATEISPGTTIPSTPPHLDVGDLYDAGRWESAYRQLHDAPNLIVKLQDDLSRSRQREAFWISVFVHLVIVIAVMNSSKFARFIPHHAVVMVNPNDWTHQKDLTYLEMPPDAQKVTKRPNTNIISDKDRIATSRTPHIDPKELQKILDSARPGPRGNASQPVQQPAPPSPYGGQQGTQGQPQQQQAQQSIPQKPFDNNQTARLQTPPMTQPKPSFSTGGSASSSIDQAARAAIANRGGSYGGDGDYGIGQGRQPQALGQLDVLSDTMGVDFGPYLSRVLHDVRENWYRLIPDSARAPLRKKGKVSIEFAILKDGKVAGMSLVSTSGDVALDRGAWGGITASNPFPPLPTEFRGQYLALRFHFFYNPEQNDLQ